MQSIPLLIISSGFDDQEASKAGLNSQQKAKLGGNGHEGFLKWGYPKWMVYSGTFSPKNDLGVALFRKPPDGKRIERALTCFHLIRGFMEVFPIKDIRLTNVGW